MGLSNSCCCSCSVCNEEKLLGSIHSETEKPLIDLSHSEIEEKLSKARENLMSHFEFFSQSIDSDNAKVQIEETSKGQLIKVSFVLPCQISEFSSFLDSHERNSWDNLIDFSKTLEKTESFSLIHLKYKSQLSYSSKEVILASSKNLTSTRVFTVFTSVPVEKIAKSDQVEIFEGGYEAVPSGLLKLAIHLNIGSRSLGALFQKLTEKVILDSISRLKLHLSAFQS